MKIAITGGFGFIGSKLANHLLAKNHQLILIDNFSSSVINEMQGAELIKCDITNASDLDKIKINDIDILLHLAAQSSGPKSFEIPHKDIDININGTLNMINWCLMNEVPRIIYASSFVVYGDQENAEILSENSNCYPKSIYALSKYYCENLLKIFGQPKGLNWNVMRMFNVYGPGQDLSRKDQGMVSIFIDALKNNDYFGVQGSLNRFRDFIHIDDVIQGWELSINNTEYVNQIFNLGSGQKILISELIDKILIGLNKAGKTKIEEVGKTEGDIMGCYADISKIRKIGFDPTIDLQEGINNFIKYINVNS